MLFVAFLAGSAMSQSTTTTTNKKATNTTKGISVSSTGGQVNPTKVDKTEVGNQSTTTTKMEVIKTGPAIRSKQLNKPEVDLPGFPVMENTGDGHADKANYIAARDKWITENQEIYNNYINSNK